MLFVERPITDRAEESLSLVSVTALSSKPPVGSPVAFVSVRADGVPRLGVVKVGEFENTNEKDRRTRYLYNSNYVYEPFGWETN